MIVSERSLLRLKRRAANHFSGFSEAGYSCSHRMGSPVSPKTTTPAIGRWRAAWLDPAVTSLRISLDSPCSPGSGTLGATMLEAG